MPIGKLFNLHRTGEQMSSLNETNKYPVYSFVNINESWSLNHWCEEFNLRAAELIEIVKKVGSNIEDIKEYLKMKRPQMGPYH